MGKTKLDRNILFVFYMNVSGNVSLPLKNQIEQSSKYLSLMQPFGTRPQVVVNNKALAYCD